MDPKDKKIDTVQNVFVKEVVREWSRYTFQKNIPNEQIQSQIIWNNSHVRKNDQMLFNKEWYFNGFILR